MSPNPGVLYVVATPIGNLEDLTFRALRILKEVDVIAAEDTRRTSKLLAHYEVRRPLVSLREHNEVREAPRLVSQLLAGRNIALVSDAGTPGIADPGARLVRAARDARVRVVPVPGPSAVTAALSVAGLADPEFVFAGFPPPLGTARRNWFERLARDGRALVFFEAPHRIRRTLDEAGQYFVNRPITVYRELTKINEELVDTPKTHDVAERGEFVVVIGGGEIGDAAVEGLASATALVGRITECQSLTDDEVRKILSSLANISGPAAAKVLKKHRILAKRHIE
jgi:16S rRNA (cytidine1402-2'-O)-methyltransferase